MFGGVLGKAKHIWHDPVWSKVIAAAIFAGLAWTGTHFDWWSSAVQLSLTTSIVPNWLLGFLFLIVAIALASTFFTTRRRAFKTAALSDIKSGAKKTSSINDPWAIGTVELMNSLAKVYAIHHLPSKFEYLSCKYEVKACCLTDQGENYFGHPDYSRTEVIFKPSQDPIYCWSVALSQSQATDARFFGGIRCEVRNRHGLPINTIQVPIRDPQYSEDRELLLFFDPVLRSNGDEPYTIILQQYIRDLMKPLRDKGKDELSLTPRRAAGNIGQIDLVLHFPTRYSIKAQPNSSGLGRRMSEIEVGRYEAEPGFSRVGWTGERIPAGETFGFDISL
jgi:hypothetical protein